jgi:hypothetical protein
MFSLVCAAADAAWDVANWADMKLNRARREAQERAEYEDFIRNWTDGTDHG